LYPTIDPTLNASYAGFMKMRCSLPKVELLKYVRNDKLTPMRIDNNYFKNIMQLKGSLKLDNALYLDPRTRGYVESFAADNGRFFTHFVEAVSIISEYKVLTGSQGEIRRNCKWVN
jgi:peroxidase